MRKISVWVAIIMLLIFILSWAAWDHVLKKKIQAYAALPWGTVNIHNHDFRVKIADTPAAQMQGLSYLQHLPKNQGMYFMFPQLQQSVFWMKDMAFPLDIIWIRHKVIIGILADVPAPKAWGLRSHLKLYLSPGLVDGVLELNAGMVKSNAIQIGDKIKLQYNAS